MYFLSDEGIDVSDGSGLDGEGRIKLFERGLENEKKGKLKSALKCYMACLRGLKPHSNFPLLPQCLRNVCIVSADLCDEFYDCSIIWGGGQFILMFSFFFCTYNMHKKFCLDQLCSTCILL